MHDIYTWTQRASLLSWGVLLRFLPIALALVPGAVRAQAGYVHELTGEARMHNGAGPGIAIKAGDTFLQGMIFETSRDGRLVIKFEDGQLAVLAPGTSLRVEGYRYEPHNPRTSNSAISVSGGAARVVTGMIGSTNRQALRLAVGTFDVHVRGTDVTLLADANGKPATQTVAVNLGAVLVETGRGSVHLGPRQFSTMPAGQLPSAPAPTTIAPAAVQAALNSLAAASLPVNLPVVVGSAARAAAAAARARAAISAAEGDPASQELRTAAQAAQSAAAEAASSADNQAAAAYKAAILAGYLPPAPAAFSSPTQQAFAPTLLPEPTVLFLGCTGSPC